MTAAQAQPAGDVVALPGQSRYGALAAALQARIAAGDWPAGTALPSEQALASQHGVALGTLRQAVGLLVAQGLVERQQGRGTFVRAGLSGTPMMRFFRFGAAAGEVPESRILARQVVPAPAAVAQRLAGAPGEPVLRLRRLRLLDGQPRLVEQIWLALPDCQALVDGDPAAWGDLLYPHLARACGVRVHRAVDEISFAPLGAADARSLQLPPGHPSAVVQRLTCDLNGRCIEWRTTRGDAHAFHYTVTLT